MDGLLNVTALRIVLSREACVSLWSVVEQRNDWIRKCQERNRPSVRNLKDYQATFGLVDTVPVTVCRAALVKYITGNRCKYTDTHLAV